MLGRYVLAAVALVGPCGVATSAAPPEPDGRINCAATYCPSEAVEVCEALPAAVEVRSHGYAVDCSPPFARPAPNVQGMTDHQAATVYVWADQASDRAVRAVLWHELGHVLVEERGTVFASQADEEQWAWGYSWCREPISGLGYPNRPTDCTAYR